MAFPSFLKSLPASPEEAEAQARNHPELLQSRDEEDATAHDIEAMSSSIWPSIYLRGEMTEQRSPDLGLANLRDDSVTVNITIPLYQGGAEYSRVREAKIAHERSKEAEQDTLAGLVERARQSWYNYYDSCRVIEASRKAVESAGRAVSGVHEEQAQGLRSTIDVLNAEEELLGTRLAETEAERNARLEGYRLLAAIGRLTAAELHLPTAVYDPETHFNNTVHQIAGF